VEGQLGNANAQAAAGLSEVVKKDQYLGFTFGGGCFFGHGISVSDGTATLIISAFDLYRFAVAGRYHDTSPKLAERTSFN